MLVKGVLPADNVNFDSSGFLKGWGEMMNFPYWLGGEGKGLGGSGGFSWSAKSRVSCWLSRTVSILGLQVRGREEEAEDVSVCGLLKDLGSVADWQLGSLYRSCLGSRVSGSLLRVGMELALILWRNSASLA